MTDKYPGLYRGPAGAESAANMINFIANAAIPIGSPVKLAAAGTGEESPRVTTTTTATDPLIGVVVDGSYRGTYGGVDTSITTNPSNSANAAGQDVSVVILGRVKVVVDGSTAAISAGDPLTVGSTTGYSAKATTTNFVWGRALQASTAFGDIILAMVNIEGIL